MHGLPFPGIVVVGLSIIAGLASVPARAADDQPAAEAIEFFEKKVRPLLVAECQKCHGDKKQEGGLRLDSLDAMLQGGDSGPAVAPGNVQDSLIIDAVRHGDTVQMPPNGKLKDEQIEVLVDWVRLGAIWPKGDKPTRPLDHLPGGKISVEDRQFWSFQPVKDSPPPQVKNSAWVQRPLDRFILAALEQKDLQPVAAAGKLALLRRATFDLIGLPPTPEEVEAFLADDSPQAFEHVVERLLASPHYGERWARHWLDVARYGEDQAHTFQARLYPFGYKYRDWVVGAFNSDLPYDRFVQEQIAADLLDGPDRRDNLPALGYFALGPVYYKDGGCGAKATADEMDDRVDTLTRGFLGLTVSCARCHDHKFDPIPTRDYYSLAGVFKSTQYKEYPLADDEVVAAYDKAQSAIKDKEQEAAKYIEAQAALVSLAMTDDTAKYVVAAWQLQNRRKSDAKYATADAAKAASLHDFVLDRWFEYLTSRSADNRPHLTRWRELVAAQDSQKDLSDDEAARATVTTFVDEFQAQVQELVKERKTQDEQYQAAVDAAADADKKKVPRPMLDKPKADLWEDLLGAKGLFAIPRNNQEKLLPDDAKKGLADLKAEADKLKKSAPAKYPVAHALADGAPENLKIYVRGNPLKLGDEAPRRFLEVLVGDEPAPFKQGSGRLELARAIASPDNPLTARVLVNRVWQHHFGRGLVGTPSNFGQLGQRPTHPELLDYLAIQFVKSGWSIKALHREIMLSATYQLGSSHDERNFQIDADNTLHWRHNRRRLEVEAWRDAMLAVSGNLDRTLGGPAGNLADGGNKRRTLYGAISRHNLDGLLRLFDFPDPNLTTDARTVTTVPLQQLFVLNSEFMVEQARAIARKLTADKAETDDARIRRAFALLYARPARDDEVDLGVQFLSAEEPAEASAQRSKLSRWEQYAQVLLGANEFMYVD